jgi:acetoin utilization protein AcuB
MRRIAVGDIMTREVISVNPKDNLLKCAKILVKNRVNTLLVTENKKLIGVISARDLVWAMSKKPSTKDLMKTKALDIAKTKVAVIKPSADIIQALEKMRSVNFRRLPVVSRNELLGVITLKDILRIEPELYHEIGDLSDIREEKRKIQVATNSQPPIDGFCDGCGNFNELILVEGQLICPDCRDELY